MRKNRQELEALRTELIQIESKDAKGAADLVRVVEITDELEQLAVPTRQRTKRPISARDRQELQRQLASLGTMSDHASTGQMSAAHLQTMDLGTALKEAGFRRGGPPVIVPSAVALTELKEATIDAGTDIDAVLPRRFFAPPLGLEARYAYPSFRGRTVEYGTTGVVSFRQKSRTLADPGDMVRDILSTAGKAETHTASEVASEELKQIANVQTGTPNVLLANDQLAEWVNADLVGAYRSAVDTHIVAQITAALVVAGGGGTNAFESVLYAQETVRAAGYSPDLVVMSPADGLALQLLQLTGGDSYVFSQTPPRIVITPAVGDGEGFVADRDAIGILYLTPLRVQAFEENAGQSNSSTVRAESEGLFLVQRPDAAAYLAESS